MAKYFQLKVLGNKVETQVIKIDKCPRCSSIHSELEFSLLSNTPSALWTACPETEEPIIISSGLFDYKEQLLQIVGSAPNSNSPFATKEMHQRLKIIKALEDVNSGEDVLLDDSEVQFLQNLLENYPGWLMATKELGEFLGDIDNSWRSATRNEEKNSKRKLRVIDDKSEDTIKVLE